MTSSHRLAPPPPPELIDDAVGEILLRLPPDDPACLLRASLVCKLWHGILSDPTFPDRYREFHRTPPLLGFLSGSYTSDESASHFIPVAPTSIPFRQPVFGCRALDCRHGRVLLDMVDGMGTVRSSLAVWDHFTGNHNVLTNPKRKTDPYGQSGAVLCATASCNHRARCHGGGPFQVVFVSTSHDYDEGTSAARAWVYSSEKATWSAPTSVQIQYGGWMTPQVERKRAAIVGDQLYFLLSPGAGILKYDLGRRCLTVIGSPCKYTYTRTTSMLISMEDGSLGFVGVKDDDVKDDDYSTLHVWQATKVNSNPSGSTMEWVQYRVISLNNVVPTIRPYQVVNVVGFAEGVDILLLNVGEAGRGILFELKSGQIRKLSYPVYHYYGDYFPYLSFYIPDFASHKRRALPAETK